MADAEARMRITSQRGTTLLEAMIAMTVVLVAAIGTAGLHSQQLRMNGDARRITEATSLAQDLVENIALWPYEPGAASPLFNRSTTNDTDLGDTAFSFQTMTTEQAKDSADHWDGDLPASWTGIPTAQVSAAGFERYWNVAYPDDIDANSTPDGVRIAVIVRWQGSGGWRRVVLMTMKPNPLEVR
jgi:Tfp pilus assembly protein PilV